MFKINLPVNHIQLINICFNYIWWHFFFVSTIKSEGEKFSRNDIYLLKWSCCVFHLILLASRKILLLSFSHFWNNRTSRGKAAVLNSAVFYSSTQINPLWAEAVELFLYTGLTVRWHLCKPWKKIKGLSGSLFPVTHMITCQTLFLSASGGVSQSTNLFKITDQRFVAPTVFLFLLKYHLQME